MTMLRGRPRLQRHIVETIVGFNRRYTGFVASDVEIYIYRGEQLNYMGRNNIGACAS